MDVSALPPLREVIKSHKLSADKRLGQHFLFDSNLLTKIVRQAGDAIDNHTILEIGPGPGGLTRALLEAGAHVIAVERDTRCINALAPLVEAAEGKLTLLEQDALTLNLAELSQGKKLYVVANLPYNVGTPMLVNWLENSEYFAGFTLMFQKEVAERIVATKGKHYGRLAVLCQYVCDVHYDMDVPAAAFTPPPKVDSAVVTLTPKAEQGDVELKKLQALLQAVFSQRRKMLRASLKQVTAEPETLLDKVEIPHTERPENVSVAQFCELAKLI